MLPQFTRATRKAALACLLRLPPLLCSRASCASTVHSRHSQRRTYVLTAAAAASLLPRILCFHSSPAPLAKPHLRAYCGCRRFFAPAFPQFTRATRKDALTCLLRLSPLLCSYTGAHSAHAGPGCSLCKHKASRPAWAGELLLLYYILFLLIRKPLAFLWVSMVIYAVVRNELKYLVLL